MNSLAYRRRPDWLGRLRAPCLGLLLGLGVTGASWTASAAPAPAPTVDAGTIAPVAPIAPIRAAGASPGATAPKAPLDPVGALDSMLAANQGTEAPTSGAGLALQILVLMTVLSLLPAIALTMTCFTRIIIVFSFLRQALGLPGAPPNQVLTGMALFITAFVMAPTFEEIHERAIVPVMEHKIGTAEALSVASQPIAKFMLKHTSDADLRLFYDISKRERPATREQVSMWVLVPAFTLSEVRIAFTMGFLILVPFLVIDLVTSSVLMAMGMVMLPPALVTLPLKILVFVLADGWGLVIGSLVRSLA